ncbi:nuclear transport factor 2 family protein [Xanthovirga aplysinae]|uniref:nuclear transport factor 2 family protein n=1 Tax=Xanthovirga aplysinae TaxID=2529853 RepID=UPI0012BB5247|nr:nuclear transport factor 2 family protein [Xanthovirga aplysinae]MTI31112.1 peptidase [Xanthovirga aplysinae]
MKKYFWFAVLVACVQCAYAQTEQKEVKATLLNYIEGTSYNHPNLIKKAFFEKANLYLTNKEKKLWIVPAEEYAGFFEKGEKGKFNGRIGNILSVDIEEDVALAKVEILIPAKDTRFVDVFLLKKVEGNWKIMSKSATKHESNKSGDRILFIVSNAHFYGNSDIGTGNSFPEIVSAYNTFEKAGYTVDFVSPKGGAVPLTYINLSNPLQKEYFYNNDFIAALKATKTPKEINPSHYKAVHYIGGGSAMFGVPEDKEIQAIAMSVYEDNQGIISSVCHGTAGIVNLKTKEGKYLVAGKRVNGYPDAYENKKASSFKHHPFLIQKTIEERGGTFKYSDRRKAHVEVDGKLVTGQNYQSSAPVAQKIIELLERSEVN